MNIGEAFLLGLVESATEFLPISSTGHMILTSYFLNLHQDSFAKSFNIIIQFAAILAVVTLYRKKIFSSTDLYLKLFVAFLPAAAIGLLVKDKIDVLLESVQIVAWALIVGGFVLIWLDRKFPLSSQPSESSEPWRKLSWLHCLMIGLIQCLAFIPGVSRSASTILGSMVVGLNRAEAAEFSFFLAIPTLGAASGYKLLSSWNIITSAEVMPLLVGAIVAYLGSLVAMKGFVAFLNKHGLSSFGYYRILLGAVVLLLAV